MLNKYVGKWRIAAMEQWDKEFIDLVVPGHITLKKDGLGNFQFGAVEGSIDYRIEKMGELERLVLILLRNSILWGTFVQKSLDY